MLLVGAVLKPVAQCTDHVTAELVCRASEAPPHTFVDSAEVCTKPDRTPTVCHSHQGRDGSVSDVWDKPITRLHFGSSANRDPVRLSGYLTMRAEEETQSVSGNVGLLFMTARGFNVIHHCVQEGWIHVKRVSLKSLPVSQFESLSHTAGRLQEMISAAFVFRNKCVG